MTDQNAGTGQPESSRAKTASELTGRLNALIQRAIETWNDQPELTWNEPLQAARATLGITRPDQAITILLAKLGALSGPGQLAEHAAAAVDATAKLLLSRTPPAERHRDEVENQSRRTRRAREDVVLASGLEAQLRGLTTWAIQTWTTHPDLDWDQLVQAGRDTLKLPADEVAAALLARLTVDGVPTDCRQLAAKKEAAVTATVRDLLSRDPDRSQENRGKESEVRDAAGEPDRDRSPPSDKIIIPSAATVSGVAVRHMRVPPDYQPLLSGTTHGVELCDHKGFRIRGFQSVSPPEQIPIEYLTLGKWCTGTAESGELVATEEKYLDFRMTMPVGAHETVDRISAGLIARYGCHFYHVKQASHVDPVDPMDFSSYSRLADLTLQLDTVHRWFSDDVMELDLSLRAGLGQEALSYYIRWTCAGQLVSRGRSRPINRHGEIKIDRGRLLAQDSATVKYFGLPRR